MQMQNLNECKIIVTLTPLTPLKGARARGNDLFHFLIIYESTTYCILNKQRKLMDDKGCVNAFL